MAFINSLSLRLSGSLEITDQMIVPQITLADMLFVIALDVVSQILYCGYLVYTVRTVRLEPSGFGNLLDGFAMAGKVILLWLLTGIIVFLWTLLLVIPGIIAAYRYRMAPVSADHQSPVERDRLPAPEPANDAWPEMGTVCAGPELYRLVPSMPAACGAGVRAADRAALVHPGAFHNGVPICIPLPVAYGGGVFQPAGRLAGSRGKRGYKQSCRRGETALGVLKRQEPGRLRSLGGTRQPVPEDLDRQELLCQITEQLLSLCGAGAFALHEPAWRPEACSIPGRGGRYRIPVRSYWPSHCPAAAHTSRRTVSSKGVRSPACSTSSVKVRVPACRVKAI